MLIEDSSKTAFYANNGFQGHRVWNGYKIKIGHLFSFLEVLGKTLNVVGVTMAIKIAATVIFTFRGMDLVGEDGDASLDEEVGDELNQDCRQDQLQVLLQPTKLCPRRRFASYRPLLPG